MASAPEDRRRRREDREFQRTVLAALVKPKQSSVVRFINAPFFLWLMSVLVLSVGGTYYTTYKQCIADGARIRVDWHEKTGAFLIRRSQLMLPIMQATSIEQIRDVVSNPDPKKPDSKTLRQLFADVMRLSFRIDLSAVTKEDPEFTLNQDPKTSRILSIYNGFVPFDLTDADLPEIREFFPRIYLTTMIRLFGNAITGLDVNCSPLMVTTLIFGYDPLIRLTAVAPSDYPKRLREAYPAAKAPSSK